MRGGDARSGPTHTPLRLPDTRAREDHSHILKNRATPVAHHAHPPLLPHVRRRTWSQSSATGARSSRSVLPSLGTRPGPAPSGPLSGPATFLPYEASKDADFSPRSLRPGIAERSHRLSSLCSCVREGKRRTASCACARRDSGKRRPPKARMSRCFPTYVVRAAGNGRRRTSRPFWGRERAGAQSPVILRDGIHARP